MFSVQQDQITPSQPNDDQADMDMKETSVPTIEHQQKGKGIHSYPRDGVAQEKTELSHSLHLTNEAQCITSHEYKPSRFRSATTTGFTVPQGSQPTFKSPLQEHTI